VDGQLTGNYAVVVVISQPSTLSRPRPDYTEGSKMLSYSRGPNEPLWEKTVGQVLEQTAEHSGVRQRDELYADCG